MDLGYTFMISLGQGGPWKEILGEPVKWLYPTEMVVDLGGPWNTPLWFPWARVDLG